MSEHLEEVRARFLDGHARANCQKLKRHRVKGVYSPSTSHSAAGSKKLDAIVRPEHVENLKCHLHDRAPKTVNNVLDGAWARCSKKAVEWGEIDRHPPCAIRLLADPKKPSAGFYDFDEYERLISSRQVARSEQPR